MGVLAEVSIWRKARPIVKEAVVNGPGQLQTHVWQVEGDDEKVCIIEKRAQGAFLGYRIEDKPFGRAVGDIKRRVTLYQKKHGGDHDLLT